MTDPEEKYEIRIFPGQYTYHRRFISVFANFAKPMTTFKEEKQAFLWTPELDATFQTLKEALRNAFILSYPQSRSGLSLI
jgi:hypothetical protein